MCIYIYDRYENEVVLTNMMYEKGSKGGKALPYVLPEVRLKTFTNFTKHRYFSPRLFS